MRILRKTLIVALLLIVGVPAVAGGDEQKPGDELRRRAMFGSSPVTKEVRDRQKLDGDSGVVLEKIFPDTSAADGEFKAGDVILAIGGVKVTGIPMFLKKMEEARAGDVLPSRWSVTA